MFDMANILKHTYLNLVAQPNRKVTLFFLDKEYLKEKEKSKLYFVTRHYKLKFF